MNHSDDLYRQVNQVEKERKRAARKEKWSKREKKFWKVFLFTKDGKPKSGLLIYTFCLSFVFLAIYIAAFALIIDWLTPVMEGMPVFLSNFLQSIAASAVGLAVAFVLHLLLGDKRLMFGCHLWLGLYAVATLITEGVLLRGTGGFQDFLVFFAWFIVIPVVLGIIVTYLLYKRDYKPKEQPEEKPSWKKYTDRR